MSVLDEQTIEIIESNSPILNQGYPNDLMKGLHPLWVVLLEHAIYGESYSPITHKLEPYVDKVLREETYLMDRLGYDVHDSLPHLLIPVATRHYYSFDSFFNDFAYLSMHVHLLQRDDPEVWDSKEFNVISDYKDYIKSLTYPLEKVWYELLPDSKWFE